VVTVEIAAIRGDDASVGRRRSVRARYQVVIAFLWMVGAVWVQLARSSGRPVWQAIWAEDGRYIYEQALNHPLSTTLFRPFAGYLQVVPRLLAEVAVGIPLADAAVAIAVLAALTSALLSVYIFYACRSVLCRWQRAAVAVLVVVHPAASTEINATFNNLHWFFVFAAFWACCSRRSSRSGVALDTVVVALAVLSDPLTLLLLPLAIARGWRSERKTWVLAGAMAVCGVLQYWLAISSAGPQQYGPRALQDLPGVYGLRVLTSSVVGDQELRQLWRPGSQWSVILISVTVAAVLTAAVLYARRRHAFQQMRLLALLVGYSIAFLWAPLITRGGAQYFLQFPFRLLASRYTIVPLWLLWTAMIVAAGLPQQARTRARIALPALLFVMLLAQLPANYAARGARVSGPSWRTSVAAARVACSSGHPHRRQDYPGLTLIQRPILMAGHIVAIPVAPYGYLFWAVDLRCDQLRG
jgi:hypothetical protein